MSRRWLTMEVEGLWAEVVWARAATIIRVNDSGSVLGINRI